MPLDTSSAEFFEAKYRASKDPWKVDSSHYESKKYQDTITALGGRRYKRAFEPGCSIGVLTSQLANLCDEVLAMDIAASAVRQAQDRCHALPQVHIFRGQLPATIPFGPFDLIVLSEIGYYFPTEDLDLVLWNLLDELAPGGVLLAVHWCGVSFDHRLSGDEVHDRIHLLPCLTHTLSKRGEWAPTKRYRLDRWERQ